MYHAFLQAPSMKMGSEDPSDVTRLSVWVRPRTKRDGTPVNTNAVKKIEKAAEIVISGTPSNATNEGGDTLTQLLGSDNHGSMRAMGRNMTKCYVFLFLFLFLI